VLNKFIKKAYDQLSSEGDGTQDNLVYILQRSFAIFQTYILHISCSFVLAGSPLSYELIL
jgi:hypothetical protein